MPDIGVAIDAPAMLVTGPGRLAAGSISVPPPGEGEVLVRVLTVGLCASDLAIYSNHYGAPTTFPLCFGHEWAGEVEAVGPGVERTAPGDLVTGECSLWCGECDLCARDLNLCRNIRKFGITAAGAARSHVCLAERHVHVAHRGTPELVALAEPLAVCLHALARAAAAHDEPLTTANVLVLGGGMLGTGSVIGLRHHWGCSRITLADPVPARRERAARLGAAPLVPADAGASAVDYAGLYGADGYDLVVDTTGAPAALRQAAELVRPSGTIVALGFAPELGFAPRLLTLKAARLIGSIGGSGDFDAALDLIGRHGPELRELITDRFALEDAELAFARATDREHALKVQLEVAA